MEKEQAKQIIIQAVRMLKLTYEEHLAVQQALQTLVSEDKKVESKKKK